jgi:hypothetical protein
VVVCGLGYIIYRRYFSHVDIFATSNVLLIIVIYSLCSSSLLIINKASTRPTDARLLPKSLTLQVLLSWWLFNFKTFLVRLRNLTFEPPP